MSQKRQGKFRHIYGDPAKPENQYLDLKNPLTSGEGSYVAANSKFFAVSKSGGGGPVYIRALSNAGRFAPNGPMLSVSKGKTWDMDFNPFKINMLATASDDTKAYVTEFPMEGLKESITSPTVTLQGHGKKVLLCRFNPSANSILSTASFDKSVKIWNIETSSCVNTYKDFGDNVYSQEWNANGSMLGVSSKDKKLRIFDPRDNETAQTFDGFDGAKSSKIFWVNKLGWIGGTGVNKLAKRQLRLWDIKKLDKPIYSVNLDQASSINMPHYDDDNGVLYLWGKGEGSVSYFELVNDDKKVYNLGIFRKPEPQKGGGWVPKKGLDVWKCEVQRFLKLTPKSVIPVSFIVPRKAGQDVFQEDIFPDCNAGKPALQANEWESGENKDPVLMSMDPANRKDEDENTNEQSFQKKMTYQELQQENEKLRKRIEELEKLTGQNNNDNDENKEDDNQQEETQEETQQEETTEE